MNKMNELEFRQKLLQNPQQLDDEMLQFLEQNPEQKKVVKSHKVFDDELADIMAIEVPEGLQDRILLKQSFDVPAANDGQSWYRNALAFAASFALIAVTLWVWQAPLDSDHHGHAHYASADHVMEEAVIEHIIEHAKEAPEIMTDYQEMDEKHLQRIFAAVGATLNKPIDFMSYAGDCEIQGEKGLHLVLQEEAGPVTIIVMPGQTMTGMQAFENSGFQGQMIPVKGAVVAIVGHSDEQLAMAQMHFFKAVEFG